MSASLAAAISGSRPELISATYLRLRRMGFDGAEAANLTAVKNGFAITSQPWTVRELTHQLFLRQSRSGRRWSHAGGADSGDRTPVSAIAEPTAAAAGASPSRAGSTHRGDTDPSDGRATLLTLFRSMAGPNATLDFLRPSASHRPRPDAAGDAEREGG
jgi:hypothetical protein